MKLSTIHCQLSIVSTQLSTFKRSAIIMLLLAGSFQSFGWGFYAHKLINYHAVFLLPPEMIIFYKKHIDFLKEHAVDPDKRRYMIKDEGPRHYIDIDKYGDPPYAIPRTWTEAVRLYTEDTLLQYGIVPWWVHRMYGRLTSAFKAGDPLKIIKLSAEIGHYIADAHVPLHACSNHNGQKTNQKGIHGFWESRVPELLAEKEWDYFIGTAMLISDPLNFIWDRVLESAAAADTVLSTEKILNDSFPSDRKFAFEPRNGMLTRQYSSAYTTAYDRILNNMVQRRFRQSIHSVASFWYTAWVNAGKPDLKRFVSLELSPEELHDFEVLNNQWKTGTLKGRSCD